LEKGTTRLSQQDTGERVRYKLRRSDKLLWSPD
jgi:hypothetical protein